MANKYLAQIGGRIKEVVALVSSSGASDAGKIPALDGSGKLDTSVLPSGIGVDSLSVSASEALTAGALVNVYDNASALGVRNADASAQGKEANGFVKSAVSSGGDATVYFAGQVPGLSALAPGARYYLGTTAGEASDTPPSASANVVQSVGFASSATTLEFQPKETITLA